MDTLYCPICHAKMFEGIDGEPECICGFKLNISEKMGTYVPSLLAMKHNTLKFQLWQLIYKYKPDFVVSHKSVRDVKFTELDVLFVYEDAPACSPVELPYVVLNSNSTLSFDFEDVFYIKGYLTENFLKYATAVSRSAPDCAFKPIQLLKAPLSKVLYLMCLMESDAAKGHSWFDILPVLSLGLPCVENVCQGISSEVVVYPKIDSALAFNYTYGPYFKQYGKLSHAEANNAMYCDIERRITDVQQMLPTFEEDLSDYISSYFACRDLNNKILKDYFALYSKTKANSVSDDIYCLVDASYPGGFDTTWTKLLDKYPLKNFLRFHLNYYTFIAKLREITHEGFPDYDYGKEFKMNYANIDKDCSSKEILTKFYDVLEVE